MRLLLLFVIYVSGVCLVCEGNHGSNCDSSEFPCNDGSCVDKMKWCDDVEDCMDGSDEGYCFPRTAFRANPNRCNDSFFLCPDGICIPIVGRCDGYSSCSDNADEEECDYGSIETPAPTKEPTLIPEVEHGFHSDMLNGELPIQQTNWPVNSVSENIVEVTEAPIHANVLDHDSIDNPSHNRNHGSEHTMQKSDIYFDNLPHTTEAETGRVTPTFVTLQAIDSEVTEPINTSEVVIKSENSSKIDKTNDDDNHVHVPGTKVQAHENDTEIHSHSLKDENYRDSVVKWHKTVKGDELFKDYVQLNSNEFRLEKTNAQKWLVKVRDSNYGWGDETPRAITALYLANDDFMMKQTEKLLMSNQLKLQLFAALMRNDTTKMPLGELALFVSALTASCHNPRNFYGKDLVDILRQRTDATQESSSIPPFVYFVLCSNNETTHGDVGKLQNLHGTKGFDEIGIEAMTFLAVTCMNRIPKFSGVQHSMASKFLQKIKAEGLPENLYDLALVAQALNEAQINQDLWNRSQVMKNILHFQKPDGSFGDILATYYVMPLLSGRSLVSLDEHCHSQEDQSLIPVDVLKNGKEEKHLVTYRLRYGNPPDFSQTLRLMVKKSANFLDIMRIAESLNPAYRFKYVLKNGKPFVYSIGSMVNDAQKGLYWSLYVKSPPFRDVAKENIAPHENDIRHFYPSKEEIVVFWLKPMF